MPVAAVSNEERRLALAEVVNALIADGLVPREEAERLAADRRSHKAGDAPPAGRDRRPEVERRRASRRTACCTWKR